MTGLRALIRTRLYQCGGSRPKRVYPRWMDVFLDRQKYQLPKHGPSAFQGFPMAK